MELVNDAEKAVDSANKKNTSPATDFETAIEACGFGAFNICLLLVAIAGIASTVFEISAMSYILPAAECVLNLSLMDKGILNAVTYAGCIASSVPWGYMADTMGRKKTLVCGLLLDGFCILCGAISQNKIQLIIFKFLGGVATTGPSAILMSYLSEFHGRQHRPRVMMAIGMMKTTATIILPILAFTILPLHFDFDIFGMNFQTWQVFIAATAIPSLLSGTLLLLFPESPKFLMSQGRNAEALCAFKTVYAMNTRKDKATYPFQTLFEEAPEKAAHIAAKTKESFSDGFKQLKPLISRPYLSLSLLVYFMNFFILMGQNTIRLWLPQLFASIAEFENTNSGVPGMCTILEYNVNKTSQIARSDDEFRDCEVHITPASFSNNIIVAATGFVAYLLASILINKIGNNNILKFSLAVSCVCGSALYWATTSLAILVLSSIFVAVSQVSATTVIGASVNIFPTAMRTMVVVMVMSFGRFGSLLGNVIFPLLISMGCIPPFLMVGGVMLCGSITSLFLPNANKTALK